MVQRVLVIGGTGFLGPDVTRLLEERGADVTVFHSGRHETPDAPRATRHVHGTRDELGQVLTASAVEPEVVIDMAPMTVAQIAPTVRALDGRATRLVVVSSSDVYRTYGLLRMLESGPPEAVPLREDAPLRTVLYPDRTSTPHDQREGWDPNEYDKILVERTARSVPALRATLLRLGFVFGPRSYRHYGPIRRMLDGRPAVLMAESWAAWRGTPAYSENVAAAIVLAALDDRAANRTYNVGESQPIDMLTLTTQYGHAARWGGRIVAVPDDALPPTLRPTGVDLRHELILDTSALRAELGYHELVPFHEGVRRTVDWMREHPPGPDHPSGAPPDYDQEDAVLRDVEEMRLGEAT
jgi:nucleoside-diphosphate-sugar epimerase